MVLLRVVFANFNPQEGGLVSTLPSLEYLLECSDIALSDIELKSLERSANHWKRGKAEIAEAIAQREAAGIARWLIENRPSLLEQARRTIEAEQAQTVLDFPSVRRSA